MSSRDRSLVADCSARTLLIFCESPSSALLILFKDDLGDFWGFAGLKKGVAGLPDWVRLTLLNVSRYGSAPAWT